MSRIKVEIDTTDLSIQKDIDLLKAAFGQYYNWGVKRVALINPPHGEIDLRHASQVSQSRQWVINLLKHFYGNYSKARLAEIMGVSLSTFKSKFDEYLDE